MHLGGEVEEQTHVPSDDAAAAKPRKRQRADITEGDAVIHRNDGDEAMGEEIPISSPRTKRQARLITCAGRTMAGEEDYEDHRNEIMGMMARMTQKPDVKAILEGHCEGEG